MALESWLSKVKSAISTSLDSFKTSINITANKSCSTNVGILAFEIASLMSKLLHLWRSLTKAQINSLRSHTIHQHGIRKLVSDDDAFLLSLACAEITDSLHIVSDAVSALSLRCDSPTLRDFSLNFKKFSNTCHDPYSWVMNKKEMEMKVKKMDRYIASTVALYKEMDELSDAEHNLRKLMQLSKGSQSLSGSRITMVSDLQQKIFWQRQEIKYLRQSSLWGCSLDTVVLLLARSCFTVLARIKHVFCCEGVDDDVQSSSLLRNLSVSSAAAAVHPSSDSPSSLPQKICSEALELKEKYDQITTGFLESNSTLLKPPDSTLGAAALALHYANLIIVLEKMIRTPRAVGAEARDDLYTMLPASIRAQLRARLQGVGWRVAKDAELAAEWRGAMARIVDWLVPVAQNTIRWQAERSFERRSAAAVRANVLLLQTLYFANKEKVEAAITELLVGLNYVCIFEREMSVAKEFMLQHMKLKEDGENNYDSSEKLSEL